MLLTTIMITSNMYITIIIKLQKWDDKNIETVIVLILKKVKI